MKKIITPTLLSFIVITLTPPTVLASQDFNQSGYEICRNKTESLFDAEAEVRINSSHLVREGVDEQVFFFRGYVWMDSNRDAIAIACTTDKSGRAVTRINRVGPLLPGPQQFLPAND